MLAKRSALISVRIGRDLLVVICRQSHAPGSSTLLCEPAHLHPAFTSQVDSPFRYLITGYPAFPRSSSLGLSNVGNVLVCWCTRAWTLLILIGPLVALARSGTFPNHGTNVANCFPLNVSINQRSLSGLIYPSMLLLCDVYVKNTCGRRSLALCRTMVQASERTFPTSPVC